MISENSIMQLQPNDIDIVHIPNELTPYEAEDYDFFDEKDKAKYIKDLERFIRNSIEYRILVLSCPELQMKIHLKFVLKFIILH